MSAVRTATETLGAPPAGRHRLPTPTDGAERQLRNDPMAFLADTMIIFRRAMRLALRNVVWVFVGLTQPILYLALFGPLLKKVAASPGFPPGNAWQIFVPGLLIQLGIFGASFVGFGLISEYRAGVIERMRVTPASRAALLLGRVLRDVVVLLVQATVLTVTAVAFGLRAPILGIILGIAVVGLLGAAFSALSYSAALRLKSEDALAPLLNFISVPLLLLSGILLPMSLAPTWLRWVSDANPIKHVVDGLRSLFLGHIATATTLWGLGVTVAIVAVALTLGTRTFRQESS